MAESSCTIHTQNCPSKSTTYNINQIYLLNAVLNKLMGSFASRKILSQSITSEKIFEKGDFFNTNHARVLKATSTTKFSVRIHFYLVYISMFSRLVM